MSACIINLQVGRTRRRFLFPDSLWGGSNPILPHRARGGPGQSRWAGTVRSGRSRSERRYRRSPPAAGEARKASDIHSRSRSRSHQGARNGRCRGSSGDEFIRLRRWGGRGSGVRLDSSGGDWGGRGGEGCRGSSWAPGRHWEGEVHHSSALAGEGMVVRRRWRLERQWKRVVASCAVLLCERR